MAYRLLDIDLSEPLPPLTLAPGEDGLGIVARWEDRLIGFAMRPWAPGVSVDPADLKGYVDAQFATAVLQRKADGELRARWSRSEEHSPPTLSIAICTKDRAVRLKRLLGSLHVTRGPCGFAAVEVVVIDNAPSDESTQQVVQAFPAVRYLCEPKAGLDFARNAALNAATGDYLAFLDDDVVVDRHWLEGLFDAWRSRPDAGGFTGLVLPFRLETDAQVCFETRGGFGRGFERQVFGATRFGNALHPVGSGILGAGCNMCFDRRLLLELGGFDEALDTGAPLPGGGDLDIFYRVLRAGRLMVYEPAYVVYHEHRETLPQLERQYWTWGLGFMAFLTKCRRTDPSKRREQSAIVWWWLCERSAALARALLRGRTQDLKFGWAELAGGLQGMAGEYDRSVARVRRIRGAP